MLPGVVPPARNKYWCWFYQHSSEKQQGQAIPEKYFPIVQVLNKTSNNNNKTKKPTYKNHRSPVKIFLLIAFFDQGLL